MCFNRFYFNFFFGLHTTTYTAIFFSAGNFAPYGVQEQPLTPKHRLVRVLGLGHVEHFGSLGQELHVSPAALLEAEVDGGGGVQLQEVG